MYYSKIYGHFNFEFLYEEAVNLFGSGSIFVEIGAYLGKSTCFLAEKVIDSKKNIKLNIIDNWAPHSSDAALDKEIKKFGDIHAIFLNNMTEAGVIDKLNIIKGDSTKSANLFQDSSVDFVFIDAAHDYDSVKRDIEAWLPKMKLNSILAGHDYGNKETQVKEVVDELFGNRIKIVDNIWIFNMGTV